MERQTKNAYTHVYDHFVVWHVYILLVQVHLCEKKLVERHSQSHGCRIYRRCDTTLNCCRCCA